MGVDIQTYRGRIGCFSRNFGTDVLTVQYIVNFTRGLKTIGAVVFIGILLLLAGIEENPGPISENTSRRTPANATILKVCGLPKGIGTDSLISIFENTRRQGGGNVLRVDINENDSSALVEFEEAEGLQLVLRKRPIHIDGKSVSVEIYFDEASMNESNSSQMHRAESVAETADRRPEDCGCKGSDSSNSKASTDTKGQIFYQILQRLGLEDKYPGKISMRDVLAVDPNESLVKTKISLADIPWFVLKRLMCANSESRDTAVSEEDSTENSFNLEDTSFFSKKAEFDSDISPLDVFNVVFQCCDPIMKQIFVQKLYLCKLAVPLLYRYWGTYQKQTQVLSVWPLRSLVLESKQRAASKNKELSKENDALALPTKVVAFGRIGRPRYSKSKLINSLLSGHTCSTFFNIDCPSGTTPRQLSNGQVEMFWLPTVHESKDRFQDAMTFLNLRGDLVQDFSKDLFLFITHFVDSVVIIIDLYTVLKHSKMVKDVLFQFSSLILVIIADPSNPDALKSMQNFQSNVISSKEKPKNFNLQILSSNNGTVERNVVDMLSCVTKCLSNSLQNSDTLTFEKRLLRAELTTIKTDEDDEVCQKSKLHAIELIKQMKAEGESSGWKQHLTPVHSKFSKKLGKLLKDKARQTDDRTEVDNIDAQIETVRRHQITSITKTVRFFLDIIVKNSSSSLVLKYFLCWLHFFIEREKRQILPLLMHENRSAWEKLKELKGAENLVKKEIEKQEIVISGLEKKIDEASFAVQNFFREIGYINEAIIELKEDTTKLGLPNLQQTSSIIGRLVADGHPFELIDGESFYMPYLWIKMVLKEVDTCIGSSKVMTLGVLGLQSSGKSTLLNTMFGSQFSSRTGRCTRGIHVQLIPTKTEQISPVFSYVLIVDTEGLRSPELSHMQHEHDNQLATVITGVGDITMINIMGENTTEIRDILQIIVHAFLRLKMSNEKLDIRKSCAFVHQNVTDTSASENMISGLSKLMQTLDEMTKESAESEGINDIKTFNQVIEFDIKSQVWYLKNLWQGNPPMARVNNEYSDSVVGIKCKILKKALRMTNISYKSLNDICEQAHDLWKGVLSEDFVFSFRNSLEMKAYLQMEDVVVAELWRFERLILKTVNQISQNKFADCNQNDNLRNVADNIISELGCLLSDERTKTIENIQRYFDDNEYKDITIQWKNNQQIRVSLLCDTLQQEIKKDVEKFREERSLRIMTVLCQEKDEEKLRKKSMEVINAHKGQKLNDKMIDKLFEDIWKDVFKFDTYSTSSERNIMKMQNIFRTYLENKFKQNHPLLKKAFKDSNSLAPLSGAKHLARSFCETGINEKDIGCTTFQKEKAFTSDVTKYVEDRVSQIFESIDGKITEICQVNNELTEMSVKTLMHDLDCITESILTGDSQFTFKATFYVKLYVHVCRYAHPIFENHNEKYFKMHDTAIQLEQYRLQQKMSFASHIRDRETEDLVAELISNVIESFAEERTFQSLPNKVTDELQSLLPKVKNKVISAICIDLLKKDNFENFIKYIINPHGYAMSWITKRANQHLDSIIEEISKLLLGELFRKVNRCVEKIQKDFERKPPPPIDTWIESFQNKMTSEGVPIPYESFRNVRKESSTSIQNVEYFSNKLFKHLSNSEKKLALRFKSQNSKTIKWAGFNPITRVFKKAWGCEAKCVFCGEPCAMDQSHDGCKHYSMQHRPSCCKGTYQSSTKIAVLESCNFNVQSNKKHKCIVFRYLCNNGEREGCGTSHFYKDFKTYLPNWDIPPSSSMHESSKYWMWFVSTYKYQLKERYGYLVDHIPFSWSKITKTEAEESIGIVYSA